MTVSNWQWSFGGFTFGAGTQVGVESVAGLLDLPAARTFKTERDGDFGIFSSPWKLNERTVTLKGHIAANSGQTSAQAAKPFLKALYALDAPQALTWQIPGYQGQQIYARPQKATVPVDTSFVYGLAAWTAEFRADDPFIYGIGTITGVAPPSSSWWIYQYSATVAPKATGGLTFPATFPVTFGASSGGSASVTNNGSANAAPLIVIPGPATNPTISNPTTGAQITIAGSITSAQSLVIDCRAKQLWLLTTNVGTGTQTWTTAGYLIGSITTWPTLPPGTSSISILQTTTTSTIYWADTSPIGGI